MTRSTSCSRPISGSILPSRASWFRFCVNCSSGEPLASLLPLAPSSFSPSGPLALVALGRLGRVGLLDAVGDEVDDVQARHALLVQVVDGVAVLLAEDRHQHVGAGHFLLATARALHVHDGALDHALEAQRRLRVAGVVLGEDRHRLGDDVAQVLPEAAVVGAAGLQHLHGRRVVEQRQQQVLDRHELMPGFAGLLVALADGEFEIFAEHSGPPGQ
jgi:hypothetical protein